MKTNLKHGFDGASLKVVRAYRHINELKSIMDQIRSGKANELSLTKQGNGPFELKFADLGEIGEHIPLVIGDAIHNLRAPLDHIWMALWRASGKTGFGTFPFHETRKNLEDAIAKSPIKMAFPDVEALILDHVKPYGDAGGNHVLWTITKFDKIDKHNLIIPTIKVHRIGNLTAQIGRTNIHMSGNTFINVGSIIGSNNPIEYQQNGKITLQITFPEDGLLTGKPVLPTLLNMAQATDETVKLFRETFL